MLKYLKEHWVRIIVLALVMLVLFVAFLVLLSVCAFYADDGSWMKDI